MRARRLPQGVVAAIDASRILGVRAGARSDHRFIGIWAVVVEGRVLARSWTLKRGGWYRTFLDDPLGTIEVGGRRVRVRAARVRSERVRDAVEQAYAVKYPTPGSRKYVRGFRNRARRDSTLEFLPTTEQRQRAGLAGGRGRAADSRHVTGSEADNNDESTRERRQRQTTSTSRTGRGALFRRAPRTPPGGVNYTRSCSRSWRSGNRSRFGP